MNYEPNIRFVDAHAKSNCGGDHGNLIADEFFLIYLSGVWAQSGMIGQCFDSLFAQISGELLGVASRKTIDDC